MIELINISKSYGSTTILKELTLNVNEGEFVSIRGRSGAGKSTLLKIMSCLEKPDKGQVRLFGRNPKAKRH